MTATGSSWAGLDSGLPLRLPLEQIAGSRLQVLTPEEIMVEGREPQGARVVVWDADGSTVAVGLAERLAADGREVSLVTRFGVAGPLLDWSFEASGVRAKLHQLGVPMLTERVPVRVEGESIVFVDGFGTELAVAADTLVLVEQRVADDALYRELTERRSDLDAAGIRRVIASGTASHRAILALSCWTATASRARSTPTIPTCRWCPGRSTTPTARARASRSSRSSRWDQDGDPRGRRRCDERTRRRRPGGGARPDPLGEHPRGRATRTGLRGHRLARPERLGSGAGGAPPAVLDACRRGRLRPNRLALNLRRARTSG